MKCDERPLRKFLNSNKNEFPRNLINQHLTFPFPFPILDPVNFLVNGK